MLFLWQTWNIKVSPFTLNPFCMSVVCGFGMLCSQRLIYKSNVYESKNIWPCVSRFSQRSVFVMLSLDYVMWVRDSTHLLMFSQIYRKDVSEQTSSLCLHHILDSLWVSPVCCWILQIHSNSHPSLTEVVIWINIVVFFMLTQQHPLELPVFLILFYIRIA